MEGSLRVPFITRWPGRIPAGRVSNEIVHEVDTFTTFAKLAGAAVPTDRPIDGGDQTDFLLGKTERSAHEGFPVFVADRLEAYRRIRRDADSRRLGGRTHDEDHRGVRAGPEEISADRARHAGFLLAAEAGERRLP